MKDLSNENIIHIKKDGIEYLQFRKLLEYYNIITHAYSLGTDLNFRTAKINKEALPQNEYNKAIDSYKKICNSLGTDYNNIVKTNQEHTDNIKIVEEKIPNITTTVSRKDIMKGLGLNTYEDFVYLAGKGKGFEEVIRERVSTPGARKMFFKKMRKH